MVLFLRRELLAMDVILKNKQYFKFCAYGFLKNFRFFDAFFILFFLDKGLLYAEIGILYAVREIVINVFEVPSGLIADTYGRKKSLIGSLLLYIFSFAVFYSAHDFWLFMIAFILYGIGDAFRSGTHKGMIMDYLELKHWQNQNINYYGHTRSWSQFGSAISSLVAGLIVFYSGNYQTIFLYSIIPYLANLLLIMSYPNELNRSFKKSAAKNDISLVETIKAFVSVVKKPNVLKIINTSAIHTAYIKAVKDYIQPLMVQVALMIPFMISFEVEKKNGIIIGIIYFLIYLLTSTASRFSSKIATRNKNNISFVTLVLGFAMGILSGLFYEYDLSILSLIAFVGIYVIENVRKPILTGFVADQVPNEILTSVISAQSLLRTIMTALIALVFGIIADQYGIGVSFIIVSVILTISTLVINRFYRLKSNYSR